MIKLILLIVLVIIFIFTFRNIESYQNLSDFYKIKNFLEIDDGTNGFSFFEESVEMPNTQYLNRSSSGSSSSGSSSSGSSSSGSSNNSLISGTTQVSNDINFIYIENNKLIIRNNGNLVKQSNNMIINITDPGHYVFDNSTDVVTINSEFKINIRIQNVHIDGNNVSMLLDNNNNKKGIIHNGTNSINGFDNVIIKNFFITYFEPQSSYQFTEPGSDNGEGGLCGAYFGRGAQNNVISNCYVYKFDISQYGGGIVGKYAGSKGGKLIIMNCIFSGLIQPLYSYVEDMCGGGITGAYLGHDGGKIFIYNCTNYGLIGSSGCGGIVGGYACKKNSHVVIMGCSNHGNINSIHKSGGLVGYNSCVEQSNLVILCCYCILFYMSASGYDEHFGGFVGKDSVLDRSHLNIYGCYNNYTNSDSNNNFKYFVAKAEQVEDTSIESVLHTPEQQAIHSRDNESNIIIDYCFNSNIPENFNDSLINNMEFEVASPNILLTNCGNIEFDNNASGNLLFSNSLTNYQVRIKDDNYNIFPYNLIFLEHSDKNNIINNISLINHQPTSNNMNLLQYYDTRLVTKNCAYNELYGNTRSIRYFKLMYNILNEGCPNDSMPSLNNDRYNENFSAYLRNDVCLNKSLVNCDSNVCNFGSLFNKVRCFPNPNTMSRYGQDTEAYMQNMFECNSLNEFECETNPSCDFDNNMNRCMTIT